MLGGWGVGRVAMTRFIKSEMRVRLQSRVREDQSPGGVGVQGKVKENDQATCGAP